MVKQGSKTHLLSSRLALIKLYVCLKQRVFIIIILWICAQPPHSHHWYCNQLLSTPTCCSSLSSLATSPSRRPISIFRSCFSSASCCMWCLEHVGYVSQISLCLIIREFHLYRPLSTKCLVFSCSNIFCCLLCPPSPCKSSLS